MNTIGLHGRISFQPSLLRLQKVASSKKKGVSPYDTIASIDNFCSPSYLNLLKSVFIGNESIVVIVYGFRTAEAEMLNIQFENKNNSRTNRRFSDLKFDMNLMINWKKKIAIT